MSGLHDTSVDKVLSFLSCWAIVALIIVTNDTRAEDILLTVNIKKPVALTSDKFLSYTLDPTVVLTGDAFTKNSVRSVNMAKALSPAYVRIGGPLSNTYTFERTHRPQDEVDTGFTFTESNWIEAHRWANNAGLDVLACIAPQHSESGRDPGWDSRNALDLISFSDHMGFNTSWQLGYECQTRCDVAGIDIGRDVMRLRSMLDAFPRYSRSIITGPDVVTYRTKQQQQYLQDYLNVAGTALSAITWHPDFASITLDAEGVSMHHDNLALDRDSLYRVVGRLISKKPLWLAESKPEECKRQFLGALVWIRRLGNAAKLGVQVLMRQPNDSDLFQPTPDYWVSVLHKNLVGREVLDTKIATGNRTHVHFYCQCTKPSSKYEKGSLTIFGINLTPSKVVVNLKGIKIKTLHKYILLPGFDAENRMFSETVLLNNEPLSLLNESELPEIKPAISSSSKGVTLKLPSGGIGFWVVPGLKIKTCGGLDDDSSDKMSLKKLTKRLDVAESSEESVGEDERDDDDDEDNISGEERRHSSKSGKERRRRKHRFSEEDDAERRYRKFEAKMDLERLEKLLRRRDSYDERKQQRGRTAYFGFEERSQERTNDEDDDETGEEIRSKLEEYKNRLRDYENRKRNEAKQRDRGKIAELSYSETIDSDKIVEALSLISKMENSMKSLDKVNDELAIDTLNPSLSYDVTSDLAGAGENKSPDDLFLDELLKSEKIKRTSVPTKIEEQLRAIYQMLAEEKLRRQRTIAKPTKIMAVNPLEESLQELGDDSPSRSRRDTDKKLGDDPLGLRKEGLFRRRTKNEDVRDRRNDRRTRRKDDRKEGQPVIFDPKAAADSNENNFYGFHQREPVKGFPEGDLFLSTGTSSEETAKDYDYVTDDDDAQEQGKSRKLPKVNEPMINQSESDDTTWVEDENTQLDHMPHEFLEKTKMTGQRVQENLKEYGELWEAESLGEITDHQDHFDAGDEEATVEKIVQERRPDDRDDKKAKEGVVRKLIGYYENPRSHQEEETDFFSQEKIDKSRGGARNSPRIPTGEVRNQKPVQESLGMKKRVKDFGSREFGDFTDFDSMHFGRSPISSAEDEPFYDAGYPAPRPAPRAKRSTEDLERILDREMIFQDDNNLKDCECRVIRDSRAARRRGERRNRPEKSERRKNRSREGRPSSGPGGRFDENYMHTTRSKRQAESVIEDQKALMIGAPEVPIEYVNDESESTMEQSESRESSSQSREHKDNSNNSAIPKGLNDFKNADGVEETEKLKKTEGIVGTKRIEEIKEADVAEGSEGVEKATGTEIMEEKVTDVPEESKVLNLDEEKVTAAIAKGTEVHESEIIVKRHNEAGIVVAEKAERIGAEEPKKPRSADLEIVEDLTIKDPPVGEKVTRSSTRDSEADQLFLGSESKTVKEDSTKLDYTPKTDAPSTTFAVDKSLESLKTPSTKDTQSGIGLDANGSAPKVADSPVGLASNPREVVEKENEQTEQGNGQDSTIWTTETPPVNTVLPILINKHNDKPVTGDGPVKLEDEESDAKVSTKTDESSSSNKETPKRLKVTKESPRTPRKVQKSKPTVKVVDPVKAREARLTARSEALAALRKENDAKKTIKSLEATSKLLSSENAKFQALQKKRVEHLEKLRDKLRTKRAKMVQEYRDELLDELNRSNTGEERNIKRREIMEILNHDEELRNIVDREKLDYLMLNQPIDYEVEKNEKYANTEQRQQYIPEMVEIVKPLHVKRERKVEDPRGPINYSSNSKILVSDESINSEVIKRALQERDDLSDHKVKRRAGKTYYSVVESLENPRIYKYPSYESEFGDEESGEFSEYVELPKKYQSDKDLMYAKYPRATKNNMGGKNQYARLSKTSVEDSNENLDKVVDVNNQKNRYMETTAQDGKTNTNQKHISKKKYLKDSDYDVNSKYKSPVYARFAPEKAEVYNEKLVNSRTNIGDYTSRSGNSEQFLQDIGSKIPKKTKGSKDVELDSNEWMKEDVSLEQSGLAVIDDVGLEDVLNSSKYELLMLIPVKNERKNRSRRHAGNEIIRDHEDSTSNEIPIEMTFKKKAKNNPLPKKIAIEEILLPEMDHSDDTTQSTELLESNDTEDPNDSISNSSTVLIIETSNASEASVEKEGSILDDAATIDIVSHIVSDDKARDDKNLPSLFEEAIPRLEATVYNGLGKARHLSESFEKFVGGFDNRYSDKELEFEEKNLEPIVPGMKAEDVPITCNIFSTAATNIKRFFDFLSGIVHVFRF